MAKTYFNKALGLQLYIQGGLVIETTSPSPHFFLGRRIETMIRNRKMKKQTKYCCGSNQSCKLTYDLHVGGCSCLFSDLRIETCFYLNVLKKINCRRMQRSMSKKKRRICLNVCKNTYKTSFSTCF